MDVKSSTSTSPVQVAMTAQVKATQASQRSERKTETEAKPDRASSQKAAEQTPPRATTNTRGEMIGRLLNVRA
jgi:hypothetical protein